MKKLSAAIAITLVLFYSYHLIAMEKNSRISRTNLEHDKHTQWCIAMQKKLDTMQYIIAIIKAAKRTGDGDWVVIDTPQPNNIEEKN